MSMSTTPVPSAASRDTDWSPPAGDWLSKQGGSDVVFRVSGRGSRPGSSSGFQQQNRPRSGSSRGPSRPSSAVACDPSPDASSTETVGATVGESSIASKATHRSMLLPKRPLMPRACPSSSMVIPTTGDFAWRRVSPSPASASSAPSLASPIAASAIASGLAVPSEPISVESSQRQEVVKSMVARLAKMERLSQAQADKLARQAREADALRAELNLLRRAAADAITETDGNSDEEDVAEADRAMIGDESSSDMTGLHCDISSLVCAGKVAANDSSISGDGQLNTSRSSRNYYAQVPAAVLADEVRRLRDERDQYRRQCAEMTKFLTDYGLTWVGDVGAADGDAETGDNIDGAASPSSPQKSGNGGSQKGSAPSSPAKEALATLDHKDMGIELATMAMRVEELNGTVEKVATRIVHDHRAGGAVRARLSDDQPQPLPLIFFKDGVKLGATAFKAYSSKEAKQLICDVSDGFFPYALKDDYPDGIAMKVIDRTTRTFDEWLREAQLYGDKDLLDGGDRLALAGGRALGGKPVLGLRPGGALPERVIRDGRICEVNASSVARPAALARMSVVNPAAGPVARLQVKFDGGRRAVFVMGGAQLIGDLEDAVSKWCEEHMDSAPGALGSQRATDGPDQRRIILRTTFPQRTYEDRAQTLAAAGLTPSATLFVSAAGVESSTEAAASTPAV